MGGPYLRRLSVTCRSPGAGIGMPNSSSATGDWLPVPVTGTGMLRAACGTSTSLTKPATERALPGRGWDLPPPLPGHRLGGPENLAHGASPQGPGSDGGGFGSGRRTGRRGLLLRKLTFPGSSFQTLCPPYSNGLHRWSCGDPCWFCQRPQDPSTVTCLLLVPLGFTKEVSS